MLGAFKSISEHAVTIPDENHSYGYLNDIERDILKTHFNIAASLHRHATHRYLSDMGPEAHEWLEIMPMSLSEWVIVQKRQTIDTPDRTQQIAVQKPTDYFQALHQMAVYEQQSEQAGRLIAHTETKRHYTDISAKSGVVYNTSGLPHPTRNGFIIGNADFPSNAYDRMEQQFEAIRADQSHLILNALPIPVMETGEHFFDSVSAMDNLLKQMSLVEEAVGVIKELKFRDSRMEYTPNFVKANKSQCALLAAAFHNSASSQGLEHAKTWMEQAHLCYAYYTWLDLKKYGKDLTRAKTFHYESQLQKGLKIIDKEVDKALANLGVKDKAQRHTIISAAMLDNSNCEAPLRDIRLWVTNARNYLIKQSGIKLNASDEAQLTKQMGSASKVASLLPAP